MLVGVHKIFLKITFPWEGDESDDGDVADEVAGLFSTWAERRTEAVSAFRAQI
jgi:hypothetical protein